MSGAYSDHLEKASLFGWLSHKRPLGLVVERASKCGVWTAAGAQKATDTKILFVADFDFRKHVAWYSDWQEVVQSRASLYTALPYKNIPELGAICRTSCTVLSGHVETTSARLEGERGISRHPRLRPGNFGVRDQRDA